MAFYWGGAAWRQNLHPFLSARILQIQDLLVEKTNLSAALRTRFLVVSAKDDNAIFESTVKGGKGELGAYKQTRKLKIGAENPTVEHCRFE